MKTQDEQACRRLKRRIDDLQAKMDVTLKERDELARRLHEEGETYEAIAAPFGITRVRVRDLVIRKGGLQDAHPGGKVLPVGTS